MVGSLALKSVLVIDADRASVDELRGHMAGLGVLQFQAVACPRKARSLAKQSPDLVLLDAALPADASMPTLRMLRAAGRSGAVIVMAQPTKRELADGLLRAGADAALAKPLCASSLAAALEALVNPEQQFEQLARWAVGRMGLRDAIEGLRTAMQREAMVRTQGSARGTAALLDVDRHYIQRAFRKLGVGPAPTAEPAGLRSPALGLRWDDDAETH